MNEVKIKLNDTDYIIKQSFRSLLLFEEITKRSANNFEENISDVITLFYCILKASNQKTFLFSLDQFIDLLDENQNSLNEFTNYLQDQAKDQKIENKKKIKKA
jgi:hypothetical protein